MKGEIVVFGLKFEPGEARDVPFHTYLDTPIEGPMTHRVTFSTEFGLKTSQRLGRVWDLSVVPGLLLAPAPRGAIITQVRLIPHIKQYFVPVEPSSEDVLWRMDIEALLPDMPLGMDNAEHWYILGKTEDGWFEAAIMEIVNYSPRYLKELDR